MSGLFSFCFYCLFCFFCSAKNHKLLQLFSRRSPRKTTPWNSQRQMPFFIFFIYFLLNLYEPWIMDRRSLGRLDQHCRGEFERKPQKPCSSLSQSHRLWHASNSSSLFKILCPWHTVKAELNHVSFLYWSHTWPFLFGFYEVHHFETGLHRLGYRSCVNLCVK